jgi:hypothetical protein
VDFAFSSQDLPSATFSARASAEQGFFQTLQICLLQFPAATRLDMDLGNCNFGYSKFASVLGEHTTELSSDIIQRLRHEGPRHITELVLKRYHSHLVYLAIAMPLPSLTRLRISMQGADAFSLWHFDRWSDVAAIWRSLREVELCVTETVCFKRYVADRVWDPQEPGGLWSLWVSCMCFSSGPCR